MLSRLTIDRAFFNFPESSQLMVDLFVRAIIASVRPVLTTWSYTQSNYPFQLCLRQYGPFRAQPFMPNKHLIPKVAVADD